MSLLTLQVWGTLKPGKAAVPCWACTHLCTCSWTDPCPPCRALPTIPYSCSTMLTSTGKSPSNISCSTSLHWCGSVVVHEVRTKMWISFKWPTCRTDNFFFFSGQHLWTVAEETPTITIPVSRVQCPYWSQRWIPHGALHAPPQKQRLFYFQQRAWLRVLLPAWSW